MIVSNLPATSALARSINEDAELTTPAVQLLAHVADMTALNVWMKTEDASRGRNRPKPVIAALVESRQKSLPAVSEPIDFDELRELFSRPRVAA